MKITVGDWKTRDGRKAVVAAENPNAQSSHRFVGWVETFCVSWTERGTWSAAGNEVGIDLISPWTDPVPWDWSTTPPWINWIAMDADGAWWMYQNEPEFRNVSWSGKGCTSHRVPPSHAPKWTGDFSKSKTMRPGFNGGAK